MIICNFCPQSNGNYLEGLLTQFRRSGGTKYKIDRIVTGRRNGYSNGEKEARILNLNYPINTTHYSQTLN